MIIFFHVDQGFNRMNELNNDEKLELLANPKLFQDNLVLDGYETSDLIEMLASMIRIRKTEQKLAEHRRLGDIGGPVHLGAGQEGIAVGCSSSLRPTDRVFGAHRSHSHLLALGAEIEPLFAEVLGRETGYSKGMGGSMHLWNEAVGFYGSVPIVAGTVALAVGAGLAAKMQNKTDVAVAYMGDGAIEEGIVHESLNLARVQNIPIIFVVENNLFASHMHLSFRQPMRSTTRFAEANDIPCHIVDGNNVVEVESKMRGMVEQARNGGGPSFLEAITYRWYGHVDWRDDIDVGVNRSLEDVADWRLRDPVERLKRSLIQEQAWSEEAHDGLADRLNVEVKAAWKAAESAPFPEAGALLDRVYANGSARV
jgi:TPP-dependent pyruvate/acetoin dehydrogenase alpha subunit